ncbi:DUF6634 family protein [Pleomorphomonas koreensis]|uniref:DUF6634 family protein n=1 Tax=Pleomorphomonas koreensis TaxID=257440 RepID=UPI003CCBFE29
MLVFDPRDPSVLRELDDTISLLRRLTHDLELIRAQGYPDAWHLNEAPILNSWSPEIRPAVCLAGLSSGHPMLPGSARPIVTSEVWLIAPQEGWARTLSRFYRLGKPASGGPDQ